MITKSWEFRGYEWSHDMPKWVQQNSCKRTGSPNLFVYTQEAETPCKSGQWVSIDMKGNMEIHDKKPDGWKKEVIASAAFVITVVIAIVAMLSI